MTWSWREADCYRDETSGALWLVVVQSFVSDIVCIREELLKLASLQIKYPHPQVTKYHQQLLQHI